MSEIAMTGLNEKHFPLSALASFGLLAICDRIVSLRGSKLSWKESPLWTPVLHVPGELSADGLIQALLDYFRTTQREKAREFHVASDLGKISRESYEKFVRESIEAEDWRATSFAAAYGSDILVKDTGELRPTLFHMTSGKQQWLEQVRELAETLSSSANKAADLLKEALFGPWAYKKGHSLGWDPAMERLYAYQAVAPTSVEPMREPAAVFLAVEALIFFPSVCAKRRLLTAGFFRERTNRGEVEDVFYFPVWDCPVGAKSLRSLLSIPFQQMVADEKGIRELKTRGIARVYRCNRVHTGGSSGAYYIFSYPVPCF